MLGIHLGAQFELDVVWEQPEKIPSIVQATASLTASIPKLRISSVDQGCRTRVFSAVC